MSQLSTEAFAAIIGGEAVLFTAAAGWVIRANLAAIKGLRSDIQLLLQAKVLTDDKLPNLERRLADVEDVVEENRTKLAVVASGFAGHERWHERRQLPVPGPSAG